MAGGEGSRFVAMLGRFFFVRKFFVANVFRRHVLLRRKRARVVIVIYRLNRVLRYVLGDFEVRGVTAPVADGSDIVEVIGLRLSGYRSLRRFRALGALGFL